jgi:hypothetical protein
MTYETENLSRSPQRLKMKTGGKCKKSYSKYHNLFYIFQYIIQTIKNGNARLINREEKKKRLFSYTGIFLYRKTKISYLSKTKINRVAESQAHGRTKKIERAQKLRLHHYETVNETQDYRPLSLNRSISPKNRTRSTFFLPIYVLRK